MAISHSETVIDAQGLTKTYGVVTALDSLNLSVYKGEVFGILGHNGAGKTTAVECLIGTKKRNCGSLNVLGFDPEKGDRALFGKIGVQFQHTAFQDKLRVIEACETFASLYPSVCDVSELLKRFGLSGKEKIEINTLSGGERQKLAVILALLHKPELLFLDELTTGLDPAARHEIWDFMAGLQAQGVTIVLTSHFMDEVETLCDRVLILKKGKETAVGTCAELISRTKAKNLEAAFLTYLSEDL